MTISMFWIYINFFSCLLAVIRLINYRRNGAQYKFGASFIAWVLIILLGSVPLRILTDDYSHADPFEVGINLSLCVLILLSRGNIMQIFRGVRHDKDSSR
ncbi:MULTISPECIES: phage holin family protein [Proteus]|uniref:phage holin family protein n=1 Tax=Proteus TaxID=583 RepID=UPI000D692D78|nr:phage holin family protein [Proteus faecis]